MFDVTDVEDLVDQHFSTRNQVGEYLGCPISLYPTVISSSPLTRPFARKITQKKSVRFTAVYKRKLRTNEPRHDKRRKAP
jgi:hypothetical protein